MKNSNVSFSTGLLVPQMKSSTVEDDETSRGKVEQNDSDSGLDTTSIGSQKNVKRPDDEPEGTAATAAKSDSGVSSEVSEASLKPKKQFDSKRRRIPKLGLSIKQNPDLSFIRRKAPPRCISCGTGLSARQPLVKTNGILFMKKREKELRESENRIYESVWDCAFTRSDIVADWTDDLKDHQDYCSQEMRRCLKYHRRIAESERKLALDGEEELDTGQGNTHVNNSLIINNNMNNADDEEPISTLRRENSRRISKIGFEKLKNLKSRVEKLARNQKNGARNILEVEEEFLPPPTARPKVRTRPATDEDFEINFSGKLQSTVLRLHCENCVLRDKPEEFQSVLFVCQL